MKGLLVLRSALKCHWRYSSTLSSSLPQVKLPLNYVDGQRLSPNSKDSFQLFNPATGEKLRDVSSSSAEDVDQAVQSARRELKVWRKMSGFERGNILKKAANIIRERSEELARTETLDTGKPIYEARWDITGCADTIDYYGGMAAGISGFGV